jgi:4-hydroxybenzoate polyprenyltransferase
MSLQSVSLLTGSTMLWIGVVVIAGAVALAFILPTAVVVRVIAVIALLLALGNVLYMEYQLDQKRNEISRMFNP